MRFSLGFSFSLVLTVLLSASFLIAQVLPPPVLGFVFDPVAESLRPIQGIPGASTLGAPLQITLPVTDAKIAPGQDFALAIFGSERVPAVLRLGSGDAAAMRGIDGTLPAPTGVFLSPSGTAAALYYQDKRKVQVLAGLPSFPSVVREMVVSHLPLELTALSISDDAEALLLGFSEWGAGSVFLLTADGVEQFVLGLGQASAIAFLANSRNALVADGGEDKIYMVRESGGAIETFVIADERDGLSGPTGLVVAGDNRWVFAVNSERGVIVRLDLTGGSPRLFSCPCHPTGLHRLAGSFVFRLTEPSEDPMWLLDGNPSDSRIVFVPPAGRRFDADPPGIEKDLQNTSWRTLRKRLPL